LPPMVGWKLADEDQILPLIAAISWHPTQHDGTESAQKKAPGAPGLQVDRRRKRPEEQNPLDSPRIA